MSRPDLPKEHQLKYLNRRIGEIEEIKTNLHSGNFESAVMIGHKLKGSGLTFGFPLISTLGKAIEEAGLAGDKDRALEALDQLSVHVQDNLLIHIREE